MLLVVAHRLMYPRQMSSGDCTSFASSRLRRRSSSPPSSPALVRATPRVFIERAIRSRSPAAVAAASASVALATASSLPASAVTLASSCSTAALLRLGGRELFDRPRVVVGQHVGGAAMTLEALDPPRGAQMQLAPIGARDLRVGDIAHEHVDEGVLGIALDRRPPLPANEAHPGQRVQARFELAAWRRVQRLDGAEPEGAAEHGGALQQRLVGRIESVEPRRDHALD